MLTSLKRLHATRNSFIKNGSIRSMHYAQEQSPNIHAEKTPAYISNSKDMKSKYDIIIIGAGHNGLVAANYLAKMSKKKINICVLERRHVIGGAAVTEEIIPGFKFSRASYLLSLFRPIIFKDLDLMRHGLLKFYTRNPSGYTPILESDPQYTPQTRSLTLGPNAKFNYEQISKFSKKDARKFESYENWLNGIVDILEPYLDESPPDLSTFARRGEYLKKLKLFKTYVKDMKTVRFLAKNHVDIFRLFTAPAADFLNEWFESDVLKATLATDSVIGALLSPYSNGSAYVLLHHIIGGIDNQKGLWAYVEGGMGSISNCLAVNAKSYANDVEIYVSQVVSQIALKPTNESGQMKANGVVLKDGRHIEADYVLSNCTPHVTFEKLLSEYNLAESENADISGFFKRIKNINYESGVIKINLAVSRLPDFTADPNISPNKPMPHHGCTIHFNCENMNLIDLAYQDANHRNIPSTKPMIEMVIPSSMDPTLAPKGSHVILLFCQYYPKAKDPVLDATLKQEFAQNVYNTIEQYAPGFKQSIIGQDILSPTDLENIIGLTGGNIFHGAMTLNQLFINRPVGNYGSYNTPIDGLYLAGSGSHPGGGVMGSPGRLSALLCLNKLNS